MRAAILSSLVVSCLVVPRAAAQCVERTELATTHEPGGVAGDDYGVSVDIDGGLLVAGARNAVGMGAGAVYVTPISPSPIGPAPACTLTASNGQGGDWFGHAVAIAGDWIAVGAPRVDRSAMDVGAVYLFQRSAGCWVERQVVYGTVAQDQLGYAVALSGTTLLIGMPEASSKRGAAFVYTLQGGIWARAATLSAANGLAGDRFGNSVALANGVAVVGANHTQVGGLDEAGAAYVFVRPPAGWADASYTSRLTAATPELRANLGQSVAVSGDTVLVGVVYADGGPASAKGAGYVYRKPPTGWPPAMSETEQLTACGAVAGDYFGASVAVDGDLLLLAGHFDTVGGVRAGSVRLFADNGSTWQEVATLRASNGTTGSQVGTAVALEVPYAYVGAHGGTGASAGTGAGYVFCAGRLAAFIRAGAGCAGPNGRRPALGSPTSGPMSGHPFIVPIIGLPAAGPVVGLVGGSNQTWGGVPGTLPLPFDLAPFGAPGCPLHVRPDALVPIANAGGTAAWTLPIPVSCSLLGGEFYVQAVAADPGANALGIVVSDYGTATLGI